MRTYWFEVHLNGTGRTPDEAWNDAVENFCLEPGPALAPEDFEDWDDEDDWDSMTEAEQDAFMAGLGE